MIAALRSSSVAVTTSVTIQYDPTTFVDSIQFIVPCTRGIVRTYRMNFEECVVDHPVDYKFTECQFSCYGRQLVDVLSALPHTCVRVSLTPYSSRINWRTYSEEPGTVDSMVSSDATTLLQYNIAANCPEFSKTFEVRGVRAFAELGAMCGAKLSVCGGPGVTPLSMEGEGIEENPIKLSLLVAAFDPGPMDRRPPPVDPTAPPVQHQNQNDRTPVRSGQSISSFGTSVPKQRSPTGEPFHPDHPPPPLIPLGASDALVQPPTPNHHPTMASRPSQLHGALKRSRSGDVVTTSMSPSHVSASVGIVQPSIEEEGYDYWGSLGLPPEDELHKEYTEGNFAISMKAMQLFRLGEGIRLTPYDEYVVEPSMSPHGFEGEQ
eukprot:PhF_6_TR1542/c0_g1_i1/m.2813/K10995/RAD9B; cell cycle checkpoint control protein RAD9B